MAIEEKLAAFDEVVGKLRETLIKKNHDYGDDNIGVLGVKGIFVRMHDKIARLKTLVWLREDIKVTDESANDTFMDLANYSIIAIILSKGKWK